MRAALLCAAPILLLITGCAGQAEDGLPNRREWEEIMIAAGGRSGPATMNSVDQERYRTVWTVRRASDNTRLAAVTSPPVRENGRELRVRTDSQRAGDNRPAFPEFLARLSPIRRSTQIELVTRVTVLDAVRNKKGKLKVHKRFIGALLPIRPGEKLGVNGPGDPIVVEVELVR